MIDPAYALLGDLRERMVRIETKLDVHAETSATMSSDIENLDKRLTNLEHLQKTIAALGAIIIFGATYFQSSITTLIAR